MASVKVKKIKLNENICSSCKTLSKKVIKLDETLENCIKIQKALEIKIEDLEKEIVDLRSKNETENEIKTEINIDVVDLKNKTKILELQISELVELAKPENKIEKSDMTAHDMTDDDSWTLKQGKRETRKARVIAANKTQEIEALKLAGDTLVIGDS